MRRALFTMLGLAWLGTACAPAPAPTSQGPDARPAQPARTLVVALETEPTSLGFRIVPAGGASSAFSRRLFNADLAILDDQSDPLPYLAEELPRLNTDTWRVFPDGRMETTYRLRPSLMWHDGAPLTSDAFIFSWHVYLTPDFGQAATTPFKLISSVEAPDNRTLLIRWNELYPLAGALQSIGSGNRVGLPPLPRHILGPVLESSAEALLNSSYWNHSYVGLGPYRSDRWEAGAFIEASAFERHALGAPKIQRIKLLFFTDSGAALAAMLSGETQVATDSALTVSRTAALLRQWGAGRGYLVPYFGTYLAAHFQGRGELASPLALQDLRVRQALAHAMDRPTLNEAIYEGLNPIADSPFSPTSELGRAADAAVTRYPFDLARSTQILTEAGFTRPAGGEFYIAPSGDRFSFELKSSDGSDEPLRTAMASSWRQAGLDAREASIPSRLARDQEIKSQYPGLYIGQASGGEDGIPTMGSDSIPTPQNNWRGSGLAFNGYSNSELDRLVVAFSGALDVTSRTRIATDIAKLYSENLPALSLFFPISPQVFSSDISGPKQRPASAAVSWNIHEWELR